MADPRQRGAKNPSLLEYRSSGEVDPQDSHNQKNETDRRREDEVLAPQNPLVRAAAARGVPVAPRDNDDDPDDPKDPDPPLKLIDREHKSGLVYVDVSKDHLPGDDPEPNPMYAPVGKASSITEAYALAKSLALRGSVRVVINIHGGVWNETLFFEDASVDLMGSPGTEIVGSTEFGPTAFPDVSGIIFSNDHATKPAVKLHNSPEEMARNRIPNFSKCRMTGKYQGLVSYRRFFADDCKISATTAPDYNDERAALEVYLNPLDQGPSLLMGCRIDSASSAPHLPFDQWAIKASSKINPPEWDGGYVRGTLVDNTHGFVHHNSGVVLSGCHVQGSLLAEGWNVFHDGGSVRAGRQHPTAAGRIYAHLRGFHVPYIGFVPGWVHMNNMPIRSQGIAQFLKDAHSPMALEYGGEIFLANCSHKASNNAFPQPAAIINLFSVGYAYIMNSSTPCASWGSSAVTHQAENSAINVPYLFVYDPLTL